MNNRRSASGATLFLRDGEGSRIPFVHGQNTGLRQKKKVGISRNLRPFVRLLLTIDRQHN
jgi:hypothetical protein